MIYITGDTHGGFQRFNTKNFPQQKLMGRSDYAIITGDFGGVWDDSPREAYWLDWLEEKPFTSSEEIPLNSVPTRGEDSARSIPSSSPHKIRDFAGAPKTAVADKPISRVYDGYYRQLNFSV